MKLLFTLSICVFAINTIFGQIRFEKGYFVDNENRRTECLIKNNGWRNNPVNFYYKNENSDSTKIQEISSVTEFGVYGSFKYKRFDVKIDNSSNFIDKITPDKDPVWSQEILFLKVVVEGKADLYYYENDDIKRFFYSVSDTDITQLIYKKYLIEDTKTAMNCKYRQQLWNDVRGINTQMHSLENLNYNEKDLKTYFLKYNSLGNNSKVINNTSSEKSFNFKVTPGLTYTYFTGTTLNNDFKYDFMPKIGYRIGLEIEYILPFNKNKWGIILEPTFQNYKTDAKYIGAQGEQINYNSMEFPIGIRHYLYPNKNYKLFLNASYISNYSMNFGSTIQLSKIYTPIIKIKTGTSFSVGGGIEVKKFSAEIRYYTNRQLLFDRSLIRTDYERLNFILGYKFLSK